METSPAIRALHKAQLQQILKSDTFRNSEALRRLLEYLGQRELAGETRDLKEYTVGVEAFGKPPDYDPKVDSSVRVQVGKLRQKLDEYYRTQGLKDAVIVELPKGHFKLQFHEREAAPGLSLMHPGNFRRYLPWGLAVLTLVWALTATFLALRTSRREPVLERYSSADIAALWSPFLEAKRPTIISLGTPLFAKVSGDFFRNPSLNDWQGLVTSDELAALQKQLGGQAVPAYPYTGIGEASAAFELARLFLSKHRDINLVLSRALTWDDLGRNEVIFVGPPKYNLYEFDLPVQQDFFIRHGRLENLHPKPGEPNFYRETWSPDRTSLLEGYALIARLPGLHGAGYIMMLASTSTEGTRAAVEYVTRPAYAAELVHSIATAGVMPRYFEAVVRARFRSQTPIEIQQVAVRVLGK